MTTEAVPATVAKDTMLKNTRDKDSDRDTAWVEHDGALGRAMTSIMRNDTDIMRNDTELFISEQSMDDPGFKRWLGGVVFEVAYEGAGSRTA